MWNRELLSSLYIISLVQWIGCVELTFDLPDSSRECFHQDIEKNRSATLEFQVFVVDAGAICGIHICSLCNEKCINRPCVYHYRLDSLI